MKLFRKKKVLATLTSGNIATLTQSTIVAGIGSTLISMIMDMTKDEENWWNVTVNTNISSIFSASTAGANNLVTVSVNKCLQRTGFEFVKRGLIYPMIPTFKAGVKYCIVNLSNRYNIFALSAHVEFMQWVYSFIIGFVSFYIIL